MNENLKEEDVGAEKHNKSEVYTIDDCLPGMLEDLEKGKEKGSSTHIRGMDDAWTWRKQEFNIWTGYANEGKGTLIRFLSIIKAIEDDWKFVFCAPEDYPAKEFFDDIVHTIAGKSTDNSRPIHCSREEYIRAANRVKDNFYFVYIKPPNNTIKGVLEEFRILIDSTDIQTCVIDPLIKFARPKGFSERDDIYASYITTICTDFARETNTSLHLVMHQLTPRMTDNGFYPKPSMYNIKGGGTWADGTDNILSVQRPHYAKDKADTKVIFSSQKIKKQKLVGVPQEFEMKFNPKTNRYVDPTTGMDLYNFSTIKPYFSKGKA